MGKPHADLVFYCMLQKAYVQYSDEHLPLYGKGYSKFRRLYKVNSFLRLLDSLVVDYSLRLVSQQFFGFLCLALDTRLEEDIVLGMETPLLIRDENHDLTEFWSPTRRPPRAPPPSPKLQSCYTIGEQHTDSSSRYRTLRYVHQQLEHKTPDGSPYNFQIDHSDGSPRCWAQTESSSLSDYESSDNIHQNTSRYDDDGLTLVTAPSSISSMASGMNTLCELSRDSDCESLDLWIESSPKYPFSFHKPWMAALPTHESFPKASRTNPRSNAPMIGTEAHHASSPSHALKNRTRSPRTTRTGSLDPALDAPLSLSEAERSQVSVALYSPKIKTRRRYVFFA